MLRQLPPRHTQNLPKFKLRQLKKRMKPKKFKQAMQTQKLKKKLSQTPQKLKLRLKRLSKKKI